MDNSSSIRVMFGAEEEVVHRDMTEEKKGSRIRLCGGFWVNTGGEVRFTHPSSILSPLHVFAAGISEISFLFSSFSFFFVFQEKRGLVFFFQSTPGVTYSASTSLYFAQTL